MTAGQNFADDRGNIAVSYEYNCDARVPSNARKTGRNFEAFSFRRNLDDFPDDPNVVDRILYNDVRYDKWERDVQFGFTTDDERFKFYAGVNNLFDREPDVGSLNYPSSFRGRYFYAGVRVGLDQLPLGR